MRSSYFGGIGVEVLANGPCLRYRGHVFLRDILSLERVTVTLEADQKDEALRAIAQLFGELDADLIYRVLRAREDLASTAVGSGVAIPHGRVPGLSEMRAALAVHRTGLPFDAVDGADVRIFVAIVGPERHTADHLKALARISRLLRSDTVRGRILDAPGASEVFRVVMEEDATVSGR